MRHCCNLGNRGLANRRGSMAPRYCSDSFANDPTFHPWGFLLFSVEADMADAGRYELDSSD